MTSAVLASSAALRPLAALNEQPILFLAPRSATRFRKFFTANHPRHCGGQLEIKADCAALPIRSPPAFRQGFRMLNGAFTW